MTDECEEFGKWFNKQDMLLIPELGFESLEGDLAYLAYKKGREQLKSENEELRARINTLEKQKATMFKECAETSVIAGARIAQLEEALCAIRDMYFSNTATNDRITAGTLAYVAKDQLDKSTSDWLKHNNNKVLERAKEAARNNSDFHVSCGEYACGCCDAIEKLKEV